MFTPVLQKILVILSAVGTAETGPYCYYCSRLGDSRAAVEGEKHKPESFRNGNSKHDADFGSPNVRKPRWRGPGTLTKDRGWLYSLIVYFEHHIPGTVYRTFLFLLVAFDRTSPLLSDPALGLRRGNESPGEHQHLFSAYHSSTRLRDFEPSSWYQYVLLLRTPYWSRHC